jgi:DNA polymerase-3 subunit delta
MRLMKQQDQDRYLNAPEKAFPICLIYGPDQGLVYERAKQITHRLLGPSPDPMALTTLDEKEVQERDIHLADELDSPMLLASRRVIRLTLNGDGLQEAIQACLAHPPKDSFLLLLAGDLGTKSKLRALFEKHAQAPALPCYQDSPEQLRGVVQQFFNEHKIHCDSETIGWLVANLGNDRGITLMELEKIITYLGEEKQLTLETAQSVLTFSGQHGFDALALALLQSNFASLQQEYRLLMREGEMPVVVIRALANFIHRLWMLRALLDEGKPLDDAAFKSVSPPVFYKLQPAFRQFCQRYSLATIATLLGRLNELETQVKRYYPLQQELCLQSLLTLSAGLRSQGR